MLRDTFIENRGGLPDANLAGLDTDAVASMAPVALVRAPSTDRRACLRLQHLSDKSSLRLLQELVQAVKRYGRPQYLRTDNEAVLVSRLFRFSLWLLGIRQQRIEPGCPWQNGRVERFIGTVKRELTTEPIVNSEHFAQTLREIRTWYNHDRPHDHLQGRTPAEVWETAVKRET